MCFIYSIHIRINLSQQKNPAKISRSIIISFYFKLRLSIALGNNFKTNGHNLRYASPIGEQHF